MKTVTYFDILDNKEVTKCIYQASGFAVGDIVRHKNAGQFGGARASGTRIVTSAPGVVQAVEYQGENAWGGHVYTATVAWADGETYELGTSVLTKER